MIDFLGIFESFVSAFNINRSMSNPSDETENTKSEEYKQAVIDKEKRKRKEELKKHRKLDKNKSKDLEINR